MVSVLSLVGPVLPGPNVVGILARFPQSSTPSLNWFGREAVERHHAAVPFHMLREDPVRSYGDAVSGNLLVEGDNLLAPKGLLPYYAGRVECIYAIPSPRLSWRP